MTNKHKAVMFSFLVVVAFLGLIGIASLIMKFVPYGVELVMGTMISFLLGMFAVGVYAERLSVLNRRNLENKN